MNWNQIESNWKALKGNVKHQWAEITGSDLDSITSNREELTSKIQQTYGMDRQSAVKDVDYWHNSQTGYDEDNNLDGDVLDDNNFDDNNVGGNSNMLHTNNFGYDDTSAHQIQSSNDNNTMLDTTASLDHSQGPRHAGGIFGANDEDGLNDDIDKINHPNPNPQPSKKTPLASDHFKTDYQEHRSNLKGKAI